MILSNVQKFEFSDNNAINFRNLVSLIVNEKVLFCPKLGSVYAWWIPETSPNHGSGGWAKLKSVEQHYEKDPVSLWDKQTMYSCHTDIRKIVEERLNCYLVPMDDVMYSLVVPYVSEGNNFRVFINNYDKFYSTNLENRSDQLMVICKPTDYRGTLYSLKTNKVVYENETPKLDGWLSVETENTEWEQVIENDSVIERLNRPLSPETPRTPECKKQLFTEEGIPQLDEDETFDNEAHNNRMTMSMLVDEYESDESEIELTSGSECGSECGGGDGDDEQYVINSEDICASDCESYTTASDSDYDPENDSDNDNHSESSWDNDGWNDDDWDEKRQDTNGEWYTRREFYDYYGTDDAWDNLDTNVYQKYRFDETDGLWYTKEEFFQHYGSYHVWKKMNPKKRLKRQSIERAYWYASYLPCTLQSGFIHKFLDTY